MFFFPVMMADNVGYLMPNSQGMESLFSAASTASWPWRSPSASASIASTSRVRRYCKCPDRTCQRSMHANTSLLFVHCANLLQKSMWQCSGPCITGISSTYPFSAWASSIGKQTPSSLAGHWFRSAALLRIQFRTSCFVPVIFLLRDQWLIERFS